MESKLCLWVPALARGNSLQHVPCSLKTLVGFQTSGRVKPSPPALLY